MWPHPCYPGQSIHDPIESALEGKGKRWASTHHRVYRVLEGLLCGRTFWCAPTPGAKIATLPAIPLLLLQMALVLICSFVSYSAFSISHLPPSRSQATSSSIK